MDRTSAVRSQQGESWSFVRLFILILCKPNQDRVLATCDENGLEYVTDGTNFQPEVTLRNAIRQMLKNEEAYGSGETVSIIEIIYHHIVQKNAAGKRVPNGFTTCGYKKTA